MSGTDRPSDPTHVLLTGPRPSVPGSKDGGAWPRNDTIELSLLLRRGSAPAELPSMPTLGAVPFRERKFLTRAQFAAIHSVRVEEATRVREELSRWGLSVGAVDRASRTLRLLGTAADVERTFGVELHRFDHPTMTYRAPLGPVFLPNELRGTVAGVFGLDSRPQLRAHFRRNSDPAASGYSPLAVAAAYDFPANLTGVGQGVGILEFGGGFSASDLASFFNGLGLAVPEVTVVSVDGATNAPTGDPNGPDAEVELDLEIAGALAPAARLIVYFAPNTEQGFVDAIGAAVHDATNRPAIVSVSWGGPEESWSTSARSAFETATQDGALQGVTVLAASGDQGASDGGPTGSREVDFPASSPYVVGCGGTRLTLTGGVVSAETVWNDLAEDEGATGGGVSESFARPSYQSGVSVPPAPNGFAGRGVPDVAGNADPETGYAVFVDGTAAVIGGTSAVAPLWAALVARLCEGLGKPLGYANPLLYAPSAATGLREVTTGNNGGYSAGPGWNPCTGLGSPRGVRLLDDLES